MKNTMMEKAKNVALVTLPAVAGAVMPLVSYAAEGDVSPLVDEAGGATGIMDTAVTALTSSMTDIANSIASSIGSILPIALPLVGVVLVVTIGIGIFKKVASKAG